MSAIIIITVVTITPMGAVLGDFGLFCFADTVGTGTAGAGSVDSPSSAGAGRTGTCGVVSAAGVGTIFVGAGVTARRGEGGVGREIGS